MKTLQAPTRTAAILAQLLERLDAKMTAAFRAVSELARKRKLYMRDAAYVIAIDRVAQAVKSRGWV